MTPGFFIFISVALVLGGILYAVLHARSDAPQRRSEVDDGHAVPAHAGVVCADGGESSGGSGCGDGGGGCGGDGG